MTEISNLSSSDYSISNMDLNLYYCGEEVCAPGHFWGPSLRDHYLLHYIISGKGIFEYEGKVHVLQKGQGFLVAPYRLCFYKADEKEPWQYKWIGFKGLNAQRYLERASLSIEQPIFSYTADSRLEECLNEMIGAVKLHKSRDLVYKSKLYAFLSLLIEASTNDTIIKSENSTEQYVRRAMEFVYMNYSRKTSIEEMADYIGLNRKYLSKIFKDYSGTTPQDFLIKYRIEKACELMEGHSLSISSIAHSVGYEDPLLFSKIFKKIKGCSPREYRN